MSTPSYFSAEQECEFIAAEQHLLKTQRRDVWGSDADLLPWTGLALSGGGIRSAIVALGALQALAACDLLKRFDYLSSVSGGGYIAAGLQWWRSRARSVPDGAEGEAGSIQQNSETVAGAETFGLGPTDFPYGTSNPNPRGTDPKGSQTDAQRTRLAFLRDHGSYLIPGDGITIWSGIAVLFRTLFLSLIVWISLATLLFLAIILLSQKYGPQLSWLASPLPESIIPAQWTGGRCVAHAAPEAIFAGVALQAAAVEPNQALAACWAMRLRAGFAIALWIALGSVGFFALFSIAIAVLSRSPHDVAGKPMALPGSLLGMLIGLLCLLAGAVLYWLEAPDWQTYLWVSLLCISGAVLLLRAVLEQFRTARLNVTYHWRRTFERCAGLLFIPTLLIFTIGLVPVLTFYLVTYAPKTSGSAGFVALLSGAASALFGHRALVRNLPLSLGLRIVAWIGACAFLVAVLMLGYFLALLVPAPDHIRDILAIGDGTVQSRLQGAIMVAAVLALVMSVVVNVNAISLHRFYRDRLMEVFMADEGSVRDNRVRYSSAADRLMLTELGPARPYPILNTNVVLVNDGDARTAARGGDSFILSPLFSGSRATGWTSTAEHIRISGPLTLASAMAASGAAANANAAYVGIGMTRDRLLSAIMLLLNMRLGLWFTSPAKLKSWWPRVPSYLHPVFSYAFLRKGYTRNNVIVELTDGGHFENLGLYELVRRRVRVILVIDAEADAGGSFPGLVSAVRRIQEDFGVTIRFAPNLGPERLVAEAAAGYPPQAKYSKSPYLVGHIKYPGKPGKPGILIYVKSATLKELSFAVLGYKAQHPEFPHQTTLDQFFDSAQFEAYRELGYRSVLMMAKDLQLTACIDEPRKVWRRYLKLGAALQPGKGTPASPIGSPAPNNGAAGPGLKHDPEKWGPVFGKDHASPIS